MRCGFPRCGKRTSFQPLLQVLVEMSKEPRPSGSTREMITRAASADDGASPKRSPRNERETTRRPTAGRRAYTIHLERLKGAIGRILRGRERGGNRRVRGPPASTGRLG